MFSLELTHGYFALVDESDIPLIANYKWHAIRTKKKVYAATQRNGRILYMHRLLLDLTERSEQADHINGNGLDNRRCNLRIVNNQQNNWNKGPTKRNRTGVIGVSWDTRRKKYQASIRANGKSIALGRHDTIEAAKAAYDAAALKYFGEYRYGAEK